ncbi:unnamed protein product [Sphagnum balticum]
MVDSAGTRRVRSWRGGGTPIAVTTVFSWCTSTCTSVALHVLIYAVLLIISSCTSSFSSACSHVDRLPSTGLDQQQHERFINIIEENVAIKVQAAVVQDLSHLDASTSTRKLNTHHIEQQSITTELQQSKDLANHHAMPGANHPKLHSTSSSSYSLSFKKEAGSRWRRQASHDIILHQPGRVLGPPHNITALNQKFNMVETHVITTSNLLLEFITEIWKSAMWNIMVRDHHHHHHKTRPSSSQPAVVVTPQRQVVRVRRKLLSIKGTEDSNSSTKFSHSSSSSSSSSSSHDFFDDYRDPETHPPKSN